MAEPASFELRVEFAGVSLYVIDPGRRKVGLLMPDARHRGTDLAHPDQTPAVAHVGYVRFDLANLASAASGVPARDPAETPSFEVVHQLDREELELGLLDTAEAIDATNLALPD